jgi:hypothetical protein
MAAMTYSKKVVISESGRGGEPVLSPAALMAFDPGAGTDETVFDFDAISECSVVVVQGVDDGSCFDSYSD